MLARFPSPRPSHSIGVGSRRELNANMDNLVTGFCHWSYSCWRNDLNGFGFRFTEFQRVGMSRGGEKMVYRCKHLFLSCFLSSFFITSFSFPLFSNSYLFFSYSPLHFVFYSWLPPFLLYCLIPWDFSILSLRFHQPFFFSCGHLSKITH